jgi:hypothetical protein
VVTANKLRYKALTGYAVEVDEPIDAAISSSLGMVEEEERHLDG